SLITVLTFWFFCIKTKEQTPSHCHSERSEESVSISIANLTNSSSLQMKGDQAYKNSPVDYFSEGASWRIGMPDVRKARRRVGKWPKLPITLSKPAYCHPNCFQK